MRVLLPFLRNTYKGLFSSPKISCVHRIRDFVILSSTPLTTRFLIPLKSIIFNVLLHFFKYILLGLCSERETKPMDPFRTNMAPKTRCETLYRFKSQKDK